VYDGTKRVSDYLALSDGTRLLIEIPVIQCSQVPIQVPFRAIIGEQEKGGWSGDTLRPSVPPTE